MGGSIILHAAAEYGRLLSGIVLLNAWIQDTAELPFWTVVGVVLGGLFRSKRYWKVAGDTRVMTDNPEARQMLEADRYWCKEQTAAFLFQILLMRLSSLKKAKLVTVPALVMQAENDLSVVAKTNRSMYEQLGSREKVWKTYPRYWHDSQLEKDRHLLDDDLTTWLLERAVGKKIGAIQEHT